MNAMKDMLIPIAIIFGLLLVFGPKQLPKLGKMFSQSMKGLKDGMDGAVEPEAEPVPEAKPKEVEAAAAPPVDMAAELERLKAENAKLASEAVKKTDTKADSDDTE